MTKRATHDEDAHGSGDAVVLVDRRGSDDAATGAASDAGPPRPRARHRRAGGWRSAKRAAWGILAALIAAPLAFIATPLPRDLLARRPASSVRVLDAHGDELAGVRGVDGASIPLADDVVPPWVRAALLAAEDRRFDERSLAIDPRAIVRAVRDSLRAGHIVSGASTIEQQLARRLVPRERTVAGKIYEALWATRLRAHLDKPRILLEYANRLPLGNGTVGVEAAAQLYFDTPARLLSPAQAALLAGLAHAPAREDPFRHPERALARRAAILARMHDAGSVDDATLSRALAEPIDAAHLRTAQRAPHFAQSVARSLAARGLGDAVTVETSIDPALQRDVEHVIDEELGGPLGRAGVGQAAVVVVDNDTGRILAYAGSRDFFDAAREGANDGVRAKRQPGSALKPFVYGLALSRGMTPATLLPDIETTLATESGTYAPRNYDKRVHGPVRLRAALQNSYNIPAVHVAEALGPGRILGTLHAAGFDSLDDNAEHYGVGIVLGDGDVSLYEMARAYRGLARGGVVSPLVDVVAATDGAGRAIPVTASFAPRRFLPRDATALLTDIISDTSARAPAFGVDNALDLPFPVAAKTGTSRAYVDNWTAGFTHERTVAVWAGNFDGTPMRHISGITGAGAIFRRLMIAAMRGIEPAPLVSTEARDRFETVRICPLSGLRAGPSCPGAVDEHFLAGTAPTSSCSSHHLVAELDVTDLTDTVDRGRHDVAEARNRRGPCTHTRRALDFEPRYRAWARGEGLTLVDGAALCDGDGYARDALDDANSAAVRGALGREVPRFLSPRDGDELVVEPGVPGGQAVPVKIEARGATEVAVRLDDGASRTLTPPFSTWIDAVPGAHTIALLVDGAPVDRAAFTVR